MCGIAGQLAREGEVGDAALVDGLVPAGAGAAPIPPNRPVRMPRPAEPAGLPGGKE